MRRLALMLTLIFAALPGASRATAPAVTATEVAYPVEVSQDAALIGPTHFVHGYRYSAGPGATEVVLLLHGLSYGYWGWDFPLASQDPSQPYLYSTARYLASRGIDAVAIDEMGYGASDHPPFPEVRELTIPAYASMAHQIVKILRVSYQKVAIAGHSAGGEMANFEAGRYQDVDALVDISMCDVGASQEVVQDVAFNDVNGVVNDYGYFGGDVAERTRLMYDTSDAEQRIVDADNALANPTPSAEMQSISFQPAREMDPLVKAPVLVVFSDNDAIFPPDCQANQPLLYVSAPSVDTFHLPLAGHTLMLHRNAGPMQQALADWLLAH